MRDLEASLATFQKSQRNEEAKETTTNSNENDSSAVITQQIQEAIARRDKAEDQLQEAAVAAGYDYRHYKNLLPGELDVLFAVFLVFVFSPLLHEFASDCAHNCLASFFSLFFVVDVAVLTRTAACSVASSPKSTGKFRLLLHQLLLLLSLLLQSHGG